MKGDSTESQMVLNVIRIRISIDIKDKRYK